MLEKTGPWDYYGAMTGTLEFSSLKGVKTYFVGIKGTGMAALAELFQGRGAVVMGSDTEEKFYTDEVLTNLGIPYAEGFAEKNVPGDAELLIYSAAYDPDTHPEITEARSRGLRCISYTEALGVVSQLSYSAGISGVHGKTTTSAMAGTLIKHLDIPCSVLVGSAVPALGGGSTFSRGEKYFIAETCEYKRHFLSFHPQCIVITSIEPDHLDYYQDLEDIYSAFCSYCGRLPANGTCIYCADDPGACEVVRRMREKRPDIDFRPYGLRAEGEWKITSIFRNPGATVFSLGKFSSSFTLKVPGSHNVLNAAAALAVVNVILEEESVKAGPDIEERMRKGLAAFSGSRRRSEVIGRAGDVLFIDDYGHHPTEIQKTLKGMKDFYPGMRIIVDFMSHTYTRTKALLREFSESFSPADCVILHRIYGSARETEQGSVTGETLFREVKEKHPQAYYFHEVMDAAPFLKGFLQPGDLFITMGAGDNWQLGKYLYEDFQNRDKRK